MPAGEKRRKAAAKPESARTGSAPAGRRIGWSGSEVEAVEKQQQTRVGEMKPVIRETSGSAPREDAPQIQWRSRAKRHWGEELLKNMGVAAALVLCAVAVRSGEWTDAQWTDAVLTAATGDTLLDDELGKLTFVSSLFPEATLVFGETATETLGQIVSGGEVTHAWSEAEPYLAYESVDTSVKSATDGEVMGVYHADGEELLVRVRREDGLECCYGNLAESLVSVGDWVTEGQLLGSRLPETAVTLEVRRQGYSVDPTDWIRE